MGYQSGQVVNVAVNCRKVSLESLTTLHKDEDHIQVGSIACYQISEVNLLIGTATISWQNDMGSLQSGGQNKIFKITELV